MRPLWRAGIGVCPVIGDNARSRPGRRPHLRRLGRRRRCRGSSSCPSSRVTSTSRSLTSMSRSIGRNARSSSHPAEQPTDDAEPIDAVEVALGEQGMAVWSYAQPACRHNRPARQVLAQIRVSAPFGQAGRPSAWAGDGPLQRSRASIATGGWLIVDHPEHGHRIHGLTIVSPSLGGRRCAAGTRRTGRPRAPGAERRVQDEDDVRRCRPAVRTRPDVVSVRRRNPGPEAASTCGRLVATVRIRAERMG
jgi:hypothetical protein